MLTCWTQKRRGGSTWNLGQASVWVRRFGGGFEGTLGNTQELGEVKPEAVRGFCTNYGNGGEV